MNMPTHKFTFKGLLSGFVIALLAIPGTTLAQELEGNDTSAQAQALSVVSGSASLAGMIGDNAGMPTGDVDIFAIDASQASMLDIRVTSTDACSNVDPAVALFDDAGNNLRMSADVFFDMAPGQSICDAWIKPTAALPADGRYYVVVTGTPMFMSSGWVLSATTATGGGYSLDVSGVIPLAAETGGNTDTENLTETNDPVDTGEETLTSHGVMRITMEVLHWRGRDGDVSKRWKRYIKRIGKRHGLYPIPVAMFSSEDFDATTIEEDSLKFGVDGIEESLFRCSRRVFDVNRDGMKDKICFFDALKAGFDVGHVEGRLTGMSSEHGFFESAATLKIFKISKDKHKNWKKGHRHHDRRNHRAHRNHDHGNHDHD